MESVRDWIQSLAKWVVMLTLAFLAQFLLFEDIADPTSEDPWMFALLFLFVVSSISGQIVGGLGLNLPPLLGNLIAGMVLRNLPGLDMYGDHAVMNKRVAELIFDVSLSFILCKAGMSLNLLEVVKLKWVVLRLAALPFLAEVSAVAGLAVLILDFPIHWALMMGCLWAGVAPAIVIPPMLSLTADGYGAGTGIVPASIASSVGDDVLTIVLFGVFKRFLPKFMGTYEPWPMGYAKVPFELIAGGVAGAVMAMVLVLATKPTSEGETKSLDAMRLVMLLFGAVVSVFGGKFFGYPGVAATAALVLALVAGHGWGTGAKRVKEPLGKVWNFAAEPLLFGYVGCQIKFAQLDPLLVGQGLFMLIVGLFARIVVGFLCMAGRGLNWKERLFTALSQWPKATVQASLGTAALDAATGPIEEERGRQILQLMVIIILGTAATGATILAILGPKMLRKNEASQSMVDVDVDAKATTAMDGPDYEKQDDVATFALQRQATLKSLSETYDAASFP